MRGFTVRESWRPNRNCNILTFTLMVVMLCLCCVLTFWPGQKCHSKEMHRKEVTHSNGSYERKSRGRKLADEMGRAKKNSHGTLKEWCTGREWPLNCMTVISAWWRLNIRFQRSSGRFSLFISWNLTKTINRGVYTRFTNNCNNIDSKFFFFRIWGFRGIGNILLGFSVLTNRCLTRD